MVQVLRFFTALLAWLRTSQARREAEILYLRQQLIVLKRSAPARSRLKATDRLTFVWLYRLFPSLLHSSIIFKPETLLRWHRIGFRLFWRWKSRRPAGRPAVSADIRSLVRRISQENPLWGAPRIHGELLKLGIEIAQSTVAKYMERRRGPPSQGWKTFLCNHTPDIAAIDLFVVPTMGFKLLYGLVIIHLHRRRLVWTNATTNPTAEWIARQLTEAFPWEQAPRYLIRDRDSSYGAIVRSKIRAMGIRDRPTAPQSPWQNGHIERLIGSIRRECLDHVVIFDEAHLRRILTAYAGYYNELRTHLSLAKDSPRHRPNQRLGRLVARPILGGLHHQYCRM
jgi:transposase InsO family protein